MAKYSGKIGFMVTKEIEPGYWEETIVEKPYRGDVTRNTSRMQTNSNTIDDITVSNGISVIGDPFAHEKFMHIRYATFMNNKWKVSNVEIQYPRILLTLGGLYNEQQ